MRQLYALIVKEFIAIWQDKKSRFVLIVPPLLQLFVFAHAATLDVKNVSIGIWNRDSGQKSSELIHAISGSSVFSEVFTVTSQKELQILIDTQKILLAIEIDDTFSRKLLSGKQAKLQLILDGRRSNAAQIAQGYVVRIIDQFKKQQLNLFAHSRAIKESPSVLISRNYFNPNLIYTWFTVPGLVCILTTVITLTLTTMTIARERELGTFEQLLVSPLSSMQILIGKTIPAIFIGMAEGSLILVAAIYFFDIPFTGSLIAFYYAMLCYVLSIVGIGLFASSVSKTQQQALLGVFLFMMPGTTLSGFATPIENMPDWLQIATYANPLRHFLYIVRGLFLKDLPIEAVLHNTIPLLCIAFCNISFASWFFKKMR